MRLLQTVRRKLKPLVYPVLLAAGLVVLPARTVDGRSPQRPPPRVGAFELDPLWTRADSIVLGQALGADLRDEAVRHVVNRLICPVSDTDCMQVARWGYRWSATDEPLLTALASTAGVPLISPENASPPTCPWAQPARSEAGYLVALTRPRFAGDSAVLTVKFFCDNPPGYTHDVFARDHEYTLRRQDGRWRVVAKPLTRIT